MKIASKETFCQSPSAEVVEASFEIAHMIAQAEKPHNIGETLIKPCMIKAASLVLGMASNNKPAKISLSDSTIKTHIDELANDIEFRVLKKLKASLILQFSATKQLMSPSYLSCLFTFVMWDPLPLKRKCCFVDH